MRPDRRIILLVFAFLTCITLATTRTAASESSPPIRLRAGTFIPGMTEQPLPSALTIESYESNTEGYYLLQFDGPVRQVWKDPVEALGGEFLGYIPDYAFKVRMTPEQASQVQGLDHVNWLGLWQPAFKISPSINLEDFGLYRIRIETGSDIAAVWDQLADILPDDIWGEGQYITVPATGAQVQAIAQILDVAWIEKWMLPEKHNEYGGGVIMGSAQANTNGYDGSSQIVAVADTGLGGGTAATAHADIPAGRIVAIHDFQASSTDCLSVVHDGARDVDSGHGSHTALSVLSDGAADGKGKGTAPAASLVFQAIEDYVDFQEPCGLPFQDDYLLIGIPNNVRLLYKLAYNAGARIHSNSWGSNAAGEYTTDSANTDQFMWNNPDMLITFSAGNAGTDSNNNGVVDDDSIGSPATAKNVLTVGASENERSDDFACDTSLNYTSNDDDYQLGQTCSSMSGKNHLGTAGQRWGFTAEPLKSDLSAGNKEQMAPFSSRGPTDDGRIKPDVVAPGTWILSGYSDLYQEGYDGTGGTGDNPQNNAYQYDGWGMPINAAYKYMGGTSMSNPLVAGAAAVVRDFYKKVYNDDASAALVKATLINSAVDLLDENNDGVDDNDYPIPNVHEGWGRVDVNAATDGSHLFIDQTGGLSTGGSDNYSFGIASSSSPFKITLVWTDYPSPEAAANNLVNNLNLVVTAPGNTTYRGNVFSGGWSQSGGSADTINNVENVYIQTPATGTFMVSVQAANVSYGPQPYALVLDGDFTPLSGPDVSIAFDDSDASDVVLSWPGDSAMDFYEVWQSTEPYLNPGDGIAQKTTAIPGSDPVEHVHENAAGSALVNYFYAVQSISNYGQFSAVSGRKGVFDYSLTPGS